MFPGSLTANIWLQGYTGETGATIDALSPSESWLRDQRLVASVREGNGAAFARIYDRHARELLHFCRGRLDSADEADDALQQTFMKAYRALREGPEQESISLRPWLYAIARNECVSLVRRRQVHAAEAEPETGSDSVEEQVADREEMRSILSDMARLPEEQRDALLLSGLEKIPGEEVAVSLGTELERVKALVFRARLALREGREARETSCADIREQLKTLSGGSLRRRVLREHLLACEGCREFRQAGKAGVPVETVADRAKLSIRNPA